MRDEKNYALPHAASDNWGAGMSQRVFDTRVMPLFGAGLAMTAAAAYLGRNLPFGVLIAAMIAEFILVLTSGAWQRRELGSLNLGLYFLLTALSGLTLVPLLTWAGMKGGPMLIAQALGVTGISFGSLMAYSLVSRKNFSTWGSLLFVAAIGILVAMVINIFVASNLFSLIISCLSVLLFAGFVLFDMSVIKTHYSDQDYVMAAIALYLDFIGLFQHILRIMGFMSNDD